MTWQSATLIKSQQTATDIKSLFFKPSEWIPHKAGQHYDIRLTSENGYQAERSYSVASAPENTGELEFGVQLLPDGEVSPFLWTATPGTQVEIKGPLGGHFIWDHTMPGPLVLIGGGSGIVPLLSMYRHSQNHKSNREIRFIISAKSVDKIMYYDQLKSMLISRITSTEGHIDTPFLTPYLKPLAPDMPMIYVCGPTAFVEAISDILVGPLGLNPHLIRTERFG